MDADEIAALDSRNLTHVKLPVFEGPLDLLLYLIKKDELDIYDIPIEQITRRYLEYLQLIKMLDLEVAGEYLVVASTLIYIKSRMLLPHDLRPPEEEVEEDDPRWELVRQLVEYKKYKDAAFDLSQCLAREENVHRRGTALKPENTGGTLAFDKVGLFDLLAVFQKVLARANQQEDLRDIFEDRFTVSDKILLIQDQMTRRQRIVFEELFIGSASRTEIVVTFLAVLELIRLRQIDVVQESSFAPIELVRAIGSTVAEVEDAVESHEAQNLNE
jgi:segregation and condensation protein A